MTAAAPIRVVLADDSAFVRKAFNRVLAQEPGIRVVAEAADGEQALALCRELDPDVILLDLGMPVLDGLSALKALRRERARVAAVVVSAATHRGAEATLAALEIGAFDFVDKAAVGLMQLHDLRAELAAKIRAAARAERPGIAGPSQPPTGAFAAPEVLVVAASTGGPPALATVLGKLPAQFPAPVVVVQHIPSSFVGALAERIAQGTSLPVRRALDEPLRPGAVYFTSGGRDLVLTRRGDSLALASTDPVPGSPHVPSADALFHSAARVCGPRAWGLVLTGMGRDGAEGLRAIRNAGGLTVAQDETTSAVYGMPKVARELGAAFAVLPLHEIARYLANNTQPVLYPAVPRRLHGP